MEQDLLNPLIDNTTDPFSTSSTPPTIITTTTTNTTTTAPITIPITITTTTTTTTKTLNYLTDDTQFDNPELEEEFDLTGDLVPECAWNRRLDGEFENHKEFFTPPLEMLSLAFFGLRMIRYTQIERGAFKLPVLDPLEKKFEDPIMGVPIGGIGGGAICRGWRGDFVRWSIFPAGIVRSGVVYADQFSLFSSDYVPAPAVHKRSMTSKRKSITDTMSSSSSPTSSPSPLSQSPQSSPISPLSSSPPRPSLSQSSTASVVESKGTRVAVRSYSTSAPPQLGTNKQASVLYNPSKKTIPKPPIFNCWNFDALKGNKSHYFGLFPQSWTVHEGDPDPDLKLTCRQVSPVIPHDYETSSVPAGVFVWTIQNISKKVKNASLMFTFQNGDGSESDISGGHYNEFYRHEYATHEILGIKMTHNYRRNIYPTGDEESKITYTDPVSFMIATKLDYSEFGAGIIESTRNCKKTKDRVVTYNTRFETNNEESLKALWKRFQENGKLDDFEDITPSKPGVSIGSALCVSDRINPGQTITITFSLSWSAPIAR